MQQGCRHSQASVIDGMDSDMQHHSQIKPASASAARPSRYGAARHAVGAGIGLPSRTTRPLNQHPMKGMLTHSDDDQMNDHRAVSSGIYNKSVSKKGKDGGKR